MDARAANDRIAEKAKRLQFLSRVPMVCECSDRSCRAIVMVALHEYEEIRRDPNNFVIASGHELEASQRRTETPDYEVRRVGRRSRDGSGNGDRRTA